MEELVLNVVFYVFAIGAVVASLAVALSTNIIRSAFALLGVLFAVAGFYAFMRADFIVAAQIIIYVGGILVLIIFAVMLTHRITDVNVSNESAPGPAAVFAVLCVLFALCVIIATWRWERAAEPETVLSRTLLEAEKKVPHSASLRVALKRGDGTGLVPGQEFRDQFLVMDVEVEKVTDQAKSVSVELQKRVKKDGPWTAVGQTVAAVKQGTGAASHRFSNLEAARYRWVASYAGEAGPLAVSICSTCRKSEGEIRPFCQNPQCRRMTDGKAVNEGLEKGKCPECKQATAVHLACRHAACGARDKKLVTIARLHCGACGAEPSSGAVCATPGCRRAGQPLDNVAWTEMGKEFDVEVGLTRPLGRSLMNRYLLAFEVVSVLLLAALVGAAYIARKEVKEVA